MTEQTSLGVYSKIRLCVGGQREKKQNKKKLDTVVQKDVKSTNQWDFENIEFYAQYTNTPDK